MKRALLFAALILLAFLSGHASFAADPDRCLMCHKHRHLGRVDESGKIRNYHVEERIYDRSLHRGVPCSECHTHITGIPHEPVTENVDCANVCHITPPFTQEKFSHGKIIEVYLSSVHAAKPEDPPELKKDKPHCKFCHRNPLYRSLPEGLVDDHKALDRCLNCHAEKGVARAYGHIMHRLGKKTTRSRQEIVALCSKCHADEETMKKFNVSKKALTAVKTYNRTIHGKAVMLGSEKTADCISCHASNVIHNIFEKENRSATINKERLQETCRQCHSRTNNWFIRIAVHPGTEPDENPVVHAVYIFLKATLYGSLSILLGFLLLEIRARKRDGIKLLLKKGSSWRGNLKRPKGCDHAAEF